MEGQVNSPCVSVCILDREDICQGCYRSALQITDWMVYSDDEKLAVLKQCAQRRRDSGKVIL
jgi:uncharacterized protein